MRIWPLTSLLATCHRAREAFMYLHTFICIDKIYISDKSTLSIYQLLADLIWLPITHYPSLSLIYLSTYIISIEYLYYFFQVWSGKLEVCWVDCQSSVLAGGGNLQITLARPIVVQICREYTTAWKLVLRAAQLRLGSSTIIALHLSHLLAWQMLLLLIVRDRNYHKQ